jgi:hypothetical protein
MFFGKVSIKVRSQPPIIDVSNFGRSSTRLSHDWRFLFCENAPLMIFVKNVIWRKTDDNKSCRVKVDDPMFWLYRKLWYYAFSSTSTLSTVVVFNSAKLNYKYCHFETTNIWRKSGFDLTTITHRRQYRQGPMSWFYKYFRRKCHFWLKTLLNCAMSIVCWRVWSMIIKIRT